MVSSPIPRFDLLDMDAYASMAVQFSRGCPYTCDFCTETALFGHKPRVKSSERMVEELEAIVNLGYKGPVFVVDDNFVGSKNRVKPVLEAIAKFQQQNGYPLDLFTEADISMALSNELMGLMRDAGFNMVFVGLESPDKEVLRSMGKKQNVRLNLVEAVKTIQSYGMEVTAGFIVGNDSDPPDACDKIFDFCQETGIATAMVGLLTAAKGSVLYERLKEEGRLLDESAGNNTHDFRLNFIPKEAVDIAAKLGIEKGTEEYDGLVAMVSQRITQNYKILLDRLYDKSGANYFDRSETLFQNLGPHPKPSRDIRWTGLRALGLSLLTQTTFRSYSPEYRRFAGFQKVIDHARGDLTARYPERIAKAIMGHHFRQITKAALEHDPDYNPESLYQHLKGELGLFEKRLRSAYGSGVEIGGEAYHALVRDADRFLEQAKDKIALLPRRYRTKLMRRYEDSIPIHVNALIQLTPAK